MTRFYVNEIKGFKSLFFKKMQKIVIFYVFLA